MAAKRRGLGERGFDALLGISVTKEGCADEQPAALSPSPSALIQDGELRELPVEWIKPGCYQPRRDMAPDALQELADSIASQGVLQPVVVRPVGEENFEIVAGERRWRACQLAGKAVIPAIIRLVPDESASVMALVENVQRENLNAMEESIALSRLYHEFGLTHQRIAEIVGKSRASVSNLLRLLSLPKEVQRLLENSDIELGHAKALLGLPVSEQLNAANTVVDQALSVRQTEALVHRLLAKKPANQGSYSAGTVDPDIQRLENQLAETIGVPVWIQHNAKGKGRVVLKYHSLEELEGILQHIH